VLDVSVGAEALESIHSMSNNPFSFVSQHATLGYLTTSSCDAGKFINPAARGSLLPARNHNMHTRHTRYPTLRALGGLIGLMRGIGHRGGNDQGHAQCDQKMITHLVYVVVSARKAAFPS